MDWADRQIAKDSAEAESNDISKELRLREARIKDERGDALFRQLAQYIGKQVAQYNQRSGRKVMAYIEDAGALREDVGSKKPSFLVKRTEGLYPSLFVTYSPATHMIEWEFGSSTGRWVLRVGDDGSAFFQKPNGDPVDIDEIGNELLSMVNGSKYQSKSAWL